MAHVANEVHLETRPDTHAPGRPAVPSQRTCAAQPNAPVATRELTGPLSIRWSTGADGRLRCTPHRPTAWQTNEVRDPVGWRRAGLARKPRENGRTVNLDAFHNDLEEATGQDARPSASLAGSQTTDAESSLRHELNLAFADLGGAAFALAHHGALKDTRLAPKVRRIHQLYSLAYATRADRPPDPYAPAEHAATA